MMLEWTFHCPLTEGSSAAARAGTMNSKATPATTGTLQLIMCTCVFILCFHSIFFLDRPLAAAFGPLVPPDHVDPRIDRKDVAARVAGLLPPPPSISWHPPAGGSGQQPS